MADEPKLPTISTAAKRLERSPGTLQNFPEKGMVPVIMLAGGHPGSKPDDVQWLRREWGLDPQRKMRKERDA